MSVSEISQMILSTIVDLPQPVPPVIPIKYI